MNISEAIRARRSIRKYKDTPVTEEQVHALLEAAMMAPSAVNFRPWEFAVIRDKALREAIVEISPAAKPCIAAPLAILVSGRPGDQKPHLQFWQQDCGAAIQNLLLEAVGLGLGTCWCGLWPLEDRANAVRDLLKLGDEAVPLGVIAVGVPDEQPAAKGYYQAERAKFF